MCRTEKRLRASTGAGVAVTSEGIESNRWQGDVPAWGHDSGRMPGKGDGAPHAHTRPVLCNAKVWYGPQATLSDTNLRQMCYAGSEMMLTLGNPYMQASAHVCKNCDLVELPLVSSNNLRDHLSLSTGLVS